MITQKDKNLAAPTWINRCLVQVLKFKFGDFKLLLGGDLCHYKTQSDWGHSSRTQTGGLNVAGQYGLIWYRDCNANIFSAKL